MALNLDELPPDLRLKKGAASVSIEGDAIYLGLGVFSIANPDDQIDLRVTLSKEAAQKLGANLIAAVQRSKD